MKFIINDRTYDTATAIRHAQKCTKVELEDEVVVTQETLYRTPRGALFMVSRTQTRKGRSGKVFWHDEARAFETGADAVRWIEEVGAMVVYEGDLPLPVEA